MVYIDAKAQLKPNLILVTGKCCQCSISTSISFRSPMSSLALSLTPPLDFSYTQPPLFITHNKFALMDPEEHDDCVYPWEIDHAALDTFAKDQPTLNYSDDSEPLDEPGSSLTAHPEPLIDSAELSGRGVVAFPAIGQSTIYTPAFDFGEAHDSSIGSSALLPQAGLTEFPRSAQPENPSDDDDGVFALINSDPDQATTSNNEFGLPAELDPADFPALAHASYDGCCDFLSSEPMLLPSDFSSTSSEQLPRPNFPEVEVQQDVVESAGFSINYNENAVTGIFGLPSYPIISSFPRIVSPSSKFPKHSQSSAALPYRRVVPLRPKPVPISQMSGLLSTETPHSSSTSPSASYSPSDLVSTTHTARVVKGSKQKRLRSPQMRYPNIPETYLCAFQAVDALRRPRSRPPQRSDIRRSKVPKACLRCQMLGLKVIVGMFVRSVRMR